MTVEEKGEISFALDVCIQKNLREKTRKISQRDYIENLLEEYQIQEEKETPSPLRELKEDDLPTKEEDKKEAAALPVQRTLVVRLSK